MKKLCFMLVMMMTIFAGCSDGGGENPVEPTPQPEKTEIIIDSGIVANGLSLGHRKENNQFLFPPVLTGL